jgi:hypothetical protein
MKDFRIVSLLAISIVGSYGCDRAGPTPDAQLHGYIAIYETMGRGALVYLTNGPQEKQLLLDEDTRIIGTYQEDGQTPMWYFNSIYRVDGRMNWAPEEYFNEDGDLAIPRLAGSDDWVWATRIERMSEGDSNALIASGVVVPKKPAIDYEALDECIELAERTASTKDEDVRGFVFEAARKNCVDRYAQATR